MARSSPLHIRQNSGIHDSRCLKFFVPKRLNFPPMSTSTASNRYPAGTRPALGSGSGPALGLFVMGSYMADFAVFAAATQMYNWHKWAGVTVLVLSVLRLVWRFVPPAAASRLRHAADAGLASAGLPCHPRADVRPVLPGSAGGLGL